MDAHKGGGEGRAGFYYMGWGEVGLQPGGLREARGGAGFLPSTVLRALDPLE